MLCERSKEKEKTINFKRYVRKNLYKNFCRQDNCNLTINEITNLCGNKNHRPYSIITYNYDDLLENSLKLHNPPIPFKSIHQGGIPIDDFLPIYHVHGFIPQKGNISKEMVLLENEYHLLYADDSDWRNRNQTTAITEFNCLFIGNSLTDPNLRRLLYKAINKANSEKKNHYLIELIPKDVELNDEKLIREYKAMKQSDANSFGIKILWANDKSEIPLKLKMIREISTVNGVL